MMDEQQAKDIAEILNAFHPDWWKARGRFYPSYITTSREEYRRTGKLETKGVYLMLDEGDEHALFGPDSEGVAAYFSKRGVGQIYVNWGGGGSVMMDCYGQAAVEIYDYWLGQYDGESPTTEGELSEACGVSTRSVYRWIAKEERSR